MNNLLRKRKLNKMKGSDQLKNSQTQGGGSHGIGQIQQQLDEQNTIDLNLNEDLTNVAYWIYCHKI